MPFILVGHVKEPRVFLEKTYCNFNSLLIDHKGTQTVKLINREHIPFAFSFDGKTYGADADPPVVKMTPHEGTVPPEGEQTITVEFTPRLEKNYNYNAVCLVKKKATLLALNIKGEGFDIATVSWGNVDQGVMNVANAASSEAARGAARAAETKANRAWRQFSKKSCAVDEARIPSLSSFLPKLNPGVPCATMNAETPRCPASLSVVAKTTKPVNRTC